MTPIDWDDRENWGGRVHVADEPGDPVEPDDDSR